PLPSCCLCLPHPTPGPPSWSTLLPYTTLFRSGVAQAIRRGYALISGMVLVDQDPVATTDQLNEFYRAAGVEKNYRADVVTSVKRSEEHTSELQSRENLVCRLLLEKKNT